jgi:glycosyltransferase 2 family protein
VHPKLRQLLTNLARVGISAGLLTVIVFSVGPAKIATVVGAANLWLFALAILLALAGVVVRALRWQVLLRAVGARVPFSHTVYLYFVGSFFNTFLPTGFGGDVIRVLEIGEGATSQQAAGTALVDRLTGFIVLFLLALVALPFSANLLSPQVMLLIIVLAGGIVAGSALLFEGRVLRWIIGQFANLTWLARQPRLNQIYRTGLAWVEHTYGVITACGARALAGAMFWSLVFNLIQIAANVLVGQALGLRVSVWTFFLFVPVATAALLVPITISGLGLREGIYIGLFGQVGVSQAQATALSLGSYSLDFSAGVLGGVIYLASGLLGLRQKPAKAPGDLAAAPSKDH